MEELEKLVLKRIDDMKDEIIKFLLIEKKKKLNFY